MARQSVSIREYVDVRISELKANISAAQTEFNADLSGVSKELISIDSKISGLPGIGKLIGVVATALGILLAILAIMGDRFDAGLGFASTSTQQAVDATKAAKDAKVAVEKVANDVSLFSQKWDAQATRLEKILPALETLAKQVNAPENKGMGNDLLKE